HSRTKPWAGSPDTLPCRGPLRTGRASCPRIRLKQTRWDRGLGVRCVVRPYDRSGCGRDVKREDRAAVLRAGRRRPLVGGSPSEPRGSTVPTLAGIAVRGRRAGAAGRTAGIVRAGVAAGSVPICRPVVSCAVAAAPNSRFGRGRLV